MPYHGARIFIRTSFSLITKLGVCETPQAALIQQFFLIKSKNPLTVCDIMELLSTINHAPIGDISMIPQKQLTSADIFENCKDIFDSDKLKFITLLENHIDLDENIPTSNSLSLTLSLIIIMILTTLIKLLMLRNLSFILR